jgi:iron(III) transport system permease protein
MDQASAVAPAPQKNPTRRFFNTLGTYLSKPENEILLIFGVLLTVMVISPLYSIIMDSFTIHDGLEATLSKQNAGTLGITAWSVAMARGKLSQTYFWLPLGRSLALASISCIFAVIFGGLAAYLVTRTNMPCRKYISTIFIFPYIMPQWTLALVWKNLFWSAKVDQSIDGLFAQAKIYFPLWWNEGLFPSAMVLGMHYAAFAYILIGAIFRNMDANLEEAATILNTPRWKIFTRITLPMITPAILSTILLVFTNAVGSYPVPHYLKYQDLAVKYTEINTSFPGVQSVIALVMVFIGLIILGINIVSSSGRKQYTTVTGKSGQAEKTNLGKVFRWIVAIILILITAMTAIYPVIDFALESFLPNPGDYSSGLTTKWWNTDVNTLPEFYGQYGIWHNARIWDGFKGSVIVAFACSFFAGTIGMLIGYAVSKRRHSKWAQYVNGISFLPYLLPALGVGAAFFILGSKLGIYGTFLLLIIVGVLKYIPFSSRASLNAMMQLSGEIEEAAVIQNVPWWKRMFRIVIPIQKSSFISGYMLPFITCMRELTLFMMLAPQGKIVTTLLDYFDEMNLPAFSSAINLILIIFILFCNWLLGKLTGASIDQGIGGGNN